MDGILFNFRSSWGDVFDNLSDRRAGSLIKALCRHVSAGGESVDLRDPAVKMAFKFISREIDACASSSLRCSGGLGDAVSGSSSVGGVESERGVLLEILFFERRLRNAVDELERFWRYYEARGWHDGKGQPIRNKGALLRNWLVQDSRLYPDKFTRGYREMYDRAKTLPECVDRGALFMITDFRGYEEKDGCVEIFVYKNLQSFLERNLSVFKHSLRSIIGRASLTYTIRDEK